MHEIGHNLGLSHSGDDSGVKQWEYKDQSGIMGHSYKEENSPRMCFNGAKRYEAYLVDPFASLLETSN